jgi:hypothetical protein
VKLVQPLARLGEPRFELRLPLAEPSQQTGRPSVRGVQTVDWSRCGHLVPPFCAFWAALAVSREVEH